MRGSVVLCSFVVCGRIASHRIGSPRIALHRIISHCIASHRITSPRNGTARRSGTFEDARHNGSLFRDDKLNDQIPKGQPVDITVVAIASVRSVPRRAVRGGRRNASPLVFRETLVRRSRILGQDFDQCLPRRDKGHRVLAGVQERAQLVVPHESSEGFFRLLFKDDTRQDIVFVSYPVWELQPDAAGWILDDLDLVGNVPVYVGFHVVDRRSVHQIKGLDEQPSSGWFPPIYCDE
mmetsp:Transcript_13808/g.32231  ORF Transcript_13808/g.32231 Transcript_13808/m.32231 type:complete len:236 (-) Transcript_13808:636-1343(-)